MVRNLRDLLNSLDLLSIKGERNVDVKGICFDSRKVQPDNIFAAQKGTLTDGHKFINEAIEKGAKVIVCEEFPDLMPDEITFVLVKNASDSLARIADNYYNNPSSKIKLIGITGTNGKTTIATLLYQTFKKLGFKVGLLSTIKNYIDDETIETTHTTLDPIRINKLLYNMVKKGCEYCFMEVSSHAVNQNRITALRFNGGVFTNITHEHLDYHKTFDAYIKTKKTFFDLLNKNSFALTNVDDKNGKLMLQNTKAHKFNYSTRSFADFRCKVIEKHFSGMLLEFDRTEVWTHFIGDFNAHNLLAVYGTALLLNQRKEEVLKVISELTPVAGRFETIQSSEGIMAIIDYAHTPDALKNVLHTIEQLRTHNEQVITVVGAGGDRDKTKRSQMAQISAEYSNRVILTSDNPRSEDPEKIIEDMKRDVDADKLKKIISITNRKEAIRAACMMAGKGDIILVAGKGHENYQEIKGVKHHFDDKEEIKEQLS